MLFRSPAPEPEPEPEPQPEPAPEPVARKTYTVKSGDYPELIARKHGISTENFLKWNKLRRTAVIDVGDVFVVTPPQQEKPAPAAASKPAPVKEEITPAPPSEKGAAPPGTKKIIHTVALGESPWLICQKYGVDMNSFFKWNNIRRGSSIRVGLKCIVYVKE